MLLGYGGLGNGDPCAENFWSAACWLGSNAAVSTGVDAAPGTITVTSPPVSNCAGTLNADGSCTPYTQPNDTDDSTGALTTTGGNFQSIWQTWVNDVTNSANVPGNNTAGTGYLWIAALGIGVVVLIAMKGK